jgi:leucyl aminopeptidase
VAREVGLRARVLRVPELRRRKAGAILAVGSGSAHPPCLIVLEHNAPPAARRKAKRGPRRRPTICLVGKGITFDSGGLSIKPSASMASMKHDMSGGAAVIAVLRAAALLRLPLHLVGVVGAAENMPSGTAYRPDDVVTTLSGRTVEISNTDAEGRLVLADALHFAREFEPDAIIDVATLTGACSVALGNWASAVLGNNERLIEALRRAGEASGERVWPLPLWEEHREEMKGRVSDLKQTGGRNGGTITAAAFLSHFTEGVPWAHLDIAPTAHTDRPGPYQPHGATGVGVRLLLELLQGWKEIKLV